MLEEAGIGEEDIDRVCDADDPRLLAAELLSRAGSGGSAVSEGVPPPAASEDLGAESDSSDDCL